MAKKKVMGKTLLASTAQGFTAVELLVASALAGLMTVAVLGVLGLLTKHHRELLAKRTVEPWQVQLKEQLRWDFANARHCQNSPTQLRLVGFGGRDFASGAATYRPAEVSYLVKELAQRHWLIRRETHSDDRSLRNFRQEIVCGGVQRIEMQPLDPAAARTQGTIPSRFRLRLQGTGTDSIVFDQVIHVY